MSTVGSFDRTKALSELAVPYDAGSGVVSGATQQAAAVANLGITASLAELNIMDGVTATATELNYTDVTTAGTVQASKAVVVDANKDAGSFRNIRVAAAGGFYHPKGAHATVNTAGAGTYAAADLITGKIVRDCAGAGRTDTLDTGANLVAALPGCAVGDEIQVKILNNSDDAETITLAVPASGSFAATQKTHTIVQNASLIIFIRITNVTASSEAYVVYD